MTPQPSYIFILADRRVCLADDTLDPATYTSITNDERLILTPSKDLSDDELRDALQALQRTRLESSDRPKGRTRKQNYEAETGLRLTREQMETSKSEGLDDFLAALSSYTEGGDEENPV